MTSHYGAAIAKEQGLQLKIVSVYDSKGLEEQFIEKTSSNKIVSHQRGRRKCAKEPPRTADQVTDKHACGVVARLFSNSRLPVLRLNILQRQPQ